MNTRLISKELTCNAINNIKFKDVHDNPMALYRMVLKIIDEQPIVNKWVFTPSDKEKILDFIDEVEAEHQYKVYGQPESYSQYNEGWCDALDRVRNFVKNL